MGKEAPQPGWYTSAEGQMRWWDGEQWGPTAPSSPTPRKAPRSRGATIAIFVGSLLASAFIILPIFGLVIRGLMSR